MSPSIGQNRACEQRLPRKLGVSTFRRWALFLLLFALSLKGVTNKDTAQAWEIVHLPQFVDLLKHAATPAAALTVLVFSFLSLLGRRHVSFSIGTTICATTLGVYYLRSLQVGSGDASNLAAIGILACWVMAVYFSNNSASKAESTRSIVVFMMAFTLSSMALLLLGYGYPLQGSYSRFFGMTPHPNTQGAYSALAFGAFLVTAFARSAGDSAEDEKRKVALVFAVLSFLLVILSGSRTAMLAAVAAACLVLPRRVIVIIGCASILLVAIAGGMLAAFPDAPVVKAIYRMENAPLGNRTEVLGSLMNDFLAFPFLGAGDRSGVSASSYLTALSGTGIIMGAAFLLAIGSALATALKRLLSFRINRTPHCDLLYCMLFFQISILSLTEAYLFDKFGLIQITSILAMHRIERKVAMR